MSAPPPQETFTGTTHIGVVLDKSGSMGAVRRETIDGFNVWLNSMKQDPGTILVSITLFDTQHVTPVIESPVAKVNPLDESRYLPSGSTALLDAVADTIAAMDRAGETSTDRYLVCIVTDGQENASRRTSKESLAELIRQKEETGRWTFTYLSAAPDAFADASAIGVQTCNTQAYTGDALGTEQAFRSAAASTKTYAASAQMRSASFFGGRQHAGTGDARPIPISTLPPATPRDKQTAWTNTGEAASTTSTGWVSS